MSNFDKANLLCMFDEALTKIIENIEEGFPDKALLVAQVAQRGFRRALGSALQDEQVTRKI